MFAARGGRGRERCMPNEHTGSCAHALAPPPPRLTKLCLSPPGASWAHCAAPCITCAQMTEQEIKCKGGPHVRNLGQPVTGKNAHEARDYRAHASGWLRQAALWGACGVCREGVCAARLPRSLW